MSGEDFVGSTNAVEMVVQRVRERSDELVAGMLERYRREIADYAALDPAELAGDVRRVSEHNLGIMLDNLERGEPLRAEQLDPSRRGAARRVHAGVSLPGMLHAFRLWGQVVWECVLEVADAGQPAEREAALEIAGLIIRHVDQVSRAVAQAYLDEAEGLWSERETLRRDLVEVLITGQGGSEAARLQASALRVELAEHYAVVAARRLQDAGRELLRGAVETAGECLSGALVGVRQGELLAFCPVSGPADLERVRRGANVLAARLAPSLSVTFGGWHPGPGGVVAGFAEAHEALEIAVEAGVTGRAVGFDEVLLDHILRSTVHSQRLLADTLGPLRAYDAERRSELVPTLRAYFEAGYNLTRAAQALNVHANTVVYRLRRVRELTGRDPHDPDDLLLLSLGLKLVTR